MIIIQQIATFVLWLGLIPLAMGVLPVYVLKKTERSIGNMFLLGWITMLAVFQLFAVPYVIQKRTLTDLVSIITIVVTVISVMGLLVAVAEMTRGIMDSSYVLPNWKRVKPSNWLLWILFVGLVLFQTGMSLAIMTPDGDDAYYVVHAHMANVKDTMFRENPYTGYDGGLDFRHVLAPFPMFTAMLARKSGMHTTAVAHSILPLVLIPLTYVIYYRIGCVLFRKREEKIPVFMVLIAAVQIFGASSRYTNEVFFLTRTWQGKSVLANVIIPAAFYVLSMICVNTDEKENAKGKAAGGFLLLFLVNLAGALASSLGLLLLTVLEFVFLLIIAIRNRRPWLILAGIISGIPSFVYMLLYWMA